MIKFPKMHVATSVVNRILNAADELERQQPRQAAPMPVPPPVVPDPALEGLMLDEQLHQPVGDMPPLSDDPNSDTANAIEPILHGGTALDGLVDTVSAM